MGRIEDEHDIPTSERGNREYKVGFKGFDWWLSNPLERFTLGIYWSYGEWSGPMGYENGSWIGAHLHFSFLCFGATLDWIKRWEPTDVAKFTGNTTPRKRPRRAIGSPEQIVQRMKTDETFNAEIRSLLKDQ